MTRVILVLITRERETPKYMAKCGRIRMTQASVPKIHSGGESDRGGGGGGCGGVNRVELVGAVTSVEYHPGASVLNRKPHSSNLTVTGFSCVRERTETRFLVSSGETKTLDMDIRVELDGKYACPM